MYTLEEALFLSFSMAYALILRHLRTRSSKHRGVVACSLMKINRKLWVSPKNTVSGELPQNLVRVNPPVLQVYSRIRDFKIEETGWWRVRVKWKHYKDSICWTPTDLETGCPFMAFCFIISLIFVPHIYFIQVILVYMLLPHIFCFQYFLALQDFFMQKNYFRHPYLYFYINFF